MGDKGNSLGINIKKRLRLRDSCYWNREQERDYQRQTCTVVPEQAIWDGIKGKKEVYFTKLLQNQMQKKRSVLTLIMALHRGLVHEKYSSFLNL